MQQIYLFPKPGSESNEWLTVIKIIARSRFASNVINRNTIEDDVDLDQIDEIYQPSFVHTDDTSNQPIVVEHFGAIDDAEWECVMQPNDDYYSSLYVEENAYEVEVDYDEDADLDGEDEVDDQDINVNDENTEDELNYNLLKLLYVE